MIRMLPNEQFREITFERKLKRNYAISNRGRLISYTDKIQKGIELKGSMTDGYRMFGYRFVNEEKVTKYKHFFIYKLVAEYFLLKESEEQKYVLHLDYVRNNDVVNNLKWATYEEMIAHGNKSPKMIENRKKLVEHHIKSDGKKLTSTQVILIKKTLNRPDRKIRNKMLAKRFNISETHLNRIKTGENWGHIKV